MTHKGTVTLETERLILRQFTQDDYTDMFKNWANSNPDTAKYLNWNGTVFKTIENWIAIYEEAESYNWVIVLKDLGEPIGYINAHDIDNLRNMLEIGYAIGETFWHKGIVTEAARKIVSFFFEEVKVNRIAAKHNSTNPRSGGVMLNIGMSFEGPHRQASQTGCDVLCYAILAEDYFGQRIKETPTVPFECKYRLAVPADASELLKLNDLFNGEGSNSLTVIESSLKNNEQEIVCVAADGDALIGFCCGQIFKSMCYDVNYGEITELFIMEQYRRKGVASGLMSLIESAFRNQGINHFQLFTGGENKTGQAFYRKQGYRATTEMMFRKRPSEGEMKND